MLQWSVKFYQHPTLTIRGEIECSGCGVAIRRRSPKDKTERVIKCWPCAASYTMSEIEDDKVRFDPRQLRVACPEKDCGGESYIWECNVERATPGLAAIVAPFCPLRLGSRSHAATKPEKRKTRHLAATGFLSLLTMREGASTREPQSLVISNYAHMLRLSIFGC